MDVPTHLFTPDAHTSLTETTRELGHKQYEISNHLGNVLSVITDQKLPVEVGSLIVSYSAVVVTAYPSAQARHFCNDTLCILRA
jgi:hypothetical protein